MARASPIHHLEDEAAKLIGDLRQFLNLFLLHQFSFRVEPGECSQQLVLCC